MEPASPLPPAKPIVAAALATLLVALMAILAPLPARADARFVPGPCWFTVPDGEAALCGTVAVPDRRDRPATRAFRLPVAVLLSTAKQPAPDPVLFIEGGPGASPFGAGEAVEERMEAWWELSAPFRRTRNLVLFDPRGVGRAEPDTDCPELDVLGASPRPRPVSRERRAALERAAVAACADRFKAAGLDGAMFTTPVAADDAMDVATALGAQRVNLLAVSYGTRVALEAMRRYGPRVRTAVLDSVYPPDVNAVEEAPWLGSRAFRRLFDDCAGNRACRAAYPDLEGRFQTMVERLEKAPVDVPVGDAAVPLAVRLDSAGAMAALLEAMAEGDPVPRLPALVDRAARGRYERLANWVPAPWLGDPDTAEGVAFSIECRETINPADPVKLAENARRFPPFGAVSTDDPGRRVCAQWPAAVQEAAERLPVASPVPVLLLSGAYDPLTPPEWAERAASTLPKSRHLVFRSAGHLVTGSEDCATATAAQFVEQESLPPNACPNAAKPPGFDAP
ncbi:alpha/beta hydrolase [Azospirillum canadense]|uniref:alpha/beta hydrolase n=1 Tax=Azospirillum canadense TaxID=403962 RepID=UPI0022270808|nr:alpha/beta hydrolase [Azospirillum canadense]MCW2238329.1 pimeloyl-ACP methyl ester carboxylesterase [Azospirillum canadense]